MVAAHVEVICVVFSEVDRVEEVGAVGSRCDEKLHIQGLLGCSVVLCLGVGVGSRAATVGRHVKSVDLARRELLVESHRACFKVVAGGIVFLLGRFLHAHGKRHVVDYDTCHDEALGGFGRNVLEAYLSHHSCQVNVDGVQVGFLSDG